MRYGQDPDNEFAFVEDIQLLIFDEDLNFSTTFTPTPRRGDRWPVPSHCTSLPNEHKRSADGRANTAQEGLQQDGQAIQRGVLDDPPHDSFFFENGENEPVSEADTFHMFRLGMPINWRVEINRISRI
ncbi:hypothetical protein PHMEG_00011659 [Phytophthora megakarya]|uniref:Uncharacterized protein n=1 Tax=Phytophthora megakarya TaxID=4795 RepID=A0A225WC40_9STRA|nr:hypothetical protein PHMEG_00011659 [Phytophthora megakarya]